MQIKIKPHEGFREEWLPKRGSAGAAGWDICAAEDVVLLPFKPTLVPVKFDIEIPPGTAMLILPRSGNALKKGIIIPNSPGLIDEDYRGHAATIMMWIPDPALNEPEDAGRFFIVKSGDRIAQALLIEYRIQQWEIVDELSTTGRGRGGFGSTDTGAKT